MMFCVELAVPLPNILKTVEINWFHLADSIWKKVIEWDEFAKDVVGKQITRSADSIGANIAESYGCYNFGEKLQFLYYSRGSLFETKYWLNRANVRTLMKPDEVQKFVADLTSLARQLNTFASGLKGVRAQQSNKKSSTVREDSPDYIIVSLEEFSGELFSEDDLHKLGS